MHFHIQKTETWYVNSGNLILYYIDTTNAEQTSIMLYPGDIVDILPGQPHQLEALENSVIFEISSKHFDDDSYRVQPGDSQLK
jgi:mannose-6-phosphate isomerase-like protein (cupin superfamily)